MAAIEAPVGLQDDRVVLRPLADSDVAAYAGAFDADPELARLIGVDEEPTADSLLTRIAERLPAAEIVELAIADRATGAFLGSLWLHHYADRHRRLEVGFWILPEARRRGVIRRAVTLAIDWAFTDFGIERVEITTTPDNVAVQTLAVRLGFTREGLLRDRNLERGRRVSLVIFGLLRDEWHPAPTNV